MITLLENALERSDGSYLDPQDLQNLDAVVNSWQLRRRTYDLLQEAEGAIMDRMINYIERAASTAKNRLLPDGTDKCRRDSTLVLRYCATAMLLQDEELLKDRLLYWLQNIMRALKQQKIHELGQKALQKAVQELLPPENAALLLPYLRIAQEWLTQ